MNSRTYPKLIFALVGIALALTGATYYFYASKNALQSTPIQKPTNEDFNALIGKDKVVFIDRVLSVIENEIVPKTLIGVREGNKLFGAAVLNKSDLSTVLTATNSETANPLMHAEVTAIFDFYKIPQNKRPEVADTVFIATHEPCPLCLSSISWSGYNNFFYLFSYEESRDSYGIPYDIQMLAEVFRDKHGTYSEKNKFWSSWSLRDLIAQLPQEQQAAFNKRLANIQTSYSEMSKIYQQAKASGKSADVPLK